MLKSRKKRRRISRRSIRIVGTAIVLAGVLFLVPWGRVANAVSPPPTVDELYSVGREAMAANDVSTVQVTAEALAEVPEAGSYVSLFEGFVHLKSGRIRESVRVLEAVQDDPQTGALANMLAGEAMYRNGQLGDAIEAFSAAVSMDPSLTNAHRMLAAVLYDIGSTERAIEALRTVSQQAPEDPRPHRLMGLMFKDMESFEPAVAEYREALRRDPNLPERDDVLVELATCLFKIGRHEEVAELLPRCPPTGERFALEADLLLAQGKPQEAEKLVDQAIADNPTNLELLLVKGDLELLRGKADDALKTIQLAVQHHPKDYRAHHKLSQTYARLGKPDLARQSSEESIRLRDLREHFAELHARASVDTHNAELRYQLGVTARELDRIDLALPWFRAAISLDPQHAKAREALAELANKGK